MVSHVDTDTLLVELDQRHHQAATQRLATTCNRGQEMHAGRIRRALGNVLLEMGALILGDDGLVLFNAAGADVVG